MLTEVRDCDLLIVRLACILATVSRRAGNTLEAVYGPAVFGYAGFGYAGTMLSAVCGKARLGTRLIWRPHQRNHTMH